MADEVFNNQRPAIIVAVILAALTAAGLWYFFVFRSGDLPETAQETPMATAEVGVANTHTPTPFPAPVGQVAGINSPTPTPAFVAASAQTGPLEATVAVALLFTTIGLLGGSLVLRRPRAI